MATEIMEKASEELRSSNTRLAQRAKIIEEANHAVTTGNKISEIPHSPLKWDIQGIFDKFPIINKKLENQLEHIPLKNLRERNRIIKWMSQIKKIDYKIEYFKEIKLKELEKNINHKFSEPDLAALALFHQSTKNLFDELKIFFYSTKDLEIDFEPYLNLSGAANELAYIGDASIDLALAHIHWPPNISNVGELTNKRTEFASNENLARICDKWGLYDFRIHFDSSQAKINEKTVNEVKGTIIEALYGIIYIEKGLNQIISSIIALK